MIEAQDWVVLAVMLGMMAGIYLVTCGLVKLFDWIEYGSGKHDRFLQ